MSSLTRVEEVTWEQQCSGQGSMSESEHVTDTSLVSSLAYDDCEQLLETANLEILEAESLIDNIAGHGHDDRVLVDIDKNIQRLEKSQEQISEVLKAFKHLKSGDDAVDNTNVNLFQNISDSRHVLPSRVHDDEELTQIHSNNSPSKLCSNSDQHTKDISQLSSSTHTIKHSPADYHSDSEFSRHRNNGFFESFGARKQIKANKSKSIDILQSEGNYYLLTNDDPESFNSNSFQSEDSQGIRHDSIVETHPANGSNESSGDLDSVDKTQDTVRDDYTSGLRLHPAERKILYIAKEIMTSEKVYVDVLKLVNIDFRNFIQDARRNSKSQIIPTEQFLKIFSNLPEIMMLNSELLRDFEERVQNWSSFRKISDIIVKKGPYLKLYTTYVQNYSSMTTHFEESCEKFPKFRKLVKEFEKFPQCRNLKLNHYLLKPIQRLPQYKLLLEDYLKYLEDCSPDYDDTTTALRIVTEAAEHANETIKQMEKFQKMLNLQSRLGDYQIILPGRELLKEGELMKISRKGTHSRYFVLLSDCLLYCSSFSSNLSLTGASLRVTYNIPLEHLKINLCSSDTTAEDSEEASQFSITSNVRSCTLRAR